MNTSITQIKIRNRAKLDVLKSLKLPLGKYAITGSGPLGVRNLREIGDIDIIVMPDLWNALSKQYGCTDNGRVKKIVFNGQNIEAFCEGSFYSEPKHDDELLVAERIAHAELINGLPFESLEHVLYYKRRMGREKDLNDVAMIEVWQKEHLQNQPIKMKPRI